MYRMKEELIESSPAVKDMGVLVNKKLDMSQKCALTSAKTNCILSCTKREVNSRTREIDDCLPLFCPSEASSRALLGAPSTRKA